MTVAYSIVPASVRHIRPLSRSMRAAGCIAMAGFGVNARVGLRRAFVASPHCQTALIDGKPAAMWGVAGMLLGDSACAWLVLSEQVTRLPVAISREARKALRAAAMEYDEVLATVAPDDDEAVRFALHLGFRPATEDGVDEVTDSFMTDPRYRIPIGDGYVIRLGLPPREAA